MPETAELHRVNLTCPRCGISHEREYRFAYDVIKAEAKGFRLLCTRCSGKKALPRAEPLKLCAQCGCVINKQQPEPYSHLCSECVRCTKVEVACPHCGVPRLVTIRRLRERAFEGTTCLKCRNVRGSGSVIRHAPTLTVNGCVIQENAQRRLIPGLLDNTPFHAARCIHYCRCSNGLWADVLGIPKSEQCLEQASATYWEGFTAVKARPHFIKGEERRRLVSLLLETQGEIGFLSLGYCD